VTATRAARAIFGCRGGVGGLVRAVERDRRVVGQVVVGHLASRVEAGRCGILVPETVGEPTTRCVLRSALRGGSRGAECATRLGPSAMDGDRVGVRISTHERGAPACRLTLPCEASRRQTTLPHIESPRYSRSRRLSWNSAPIHGLGDKLLGPPRRG